MFSFFYDPHYDANQIIASFIEFYENLQPGEFEEYRHTHFNQLADPNQTGLSFSMKLIGGANIPVYLLASNDNKTKMIMRVADTTASGYKPSQYACELLCSNNLQSYLTIQYQEYPIANTYVMEFSEFCHEKNLHDKFISLNRRIENKEFLLVNYTKSIIQLLTVFNKLNIFFPDMKPSNFMIKGGQIILSDKKSLFCIDSLKTGIKQIKLLPDNITPDDLLPDTLFLSKHEDKIIKAFYLTHKGIKEKILHDKGHHNNINNYPFPLNHGEVTYHFLDSIDSYDKVKKVAYLCGSHPYRILDLDNLIIDSRGIPFTPGYAPPEMVTKDEYGNTVMPPYINLKYMHQYLLGITLYECVTGEQVAATKSRGHYNQHKFNYNHSVFKNETGKIWQYITEGLTANQPDKRMLISEVNQHLDQIMNIIENLPPPYVNDPFSPDIQFIF